MTLLSSFPALDRALDSRRLLRARGAPVLVFALSLLTACGDTNIDGELGVGTFRYVCLDEGDAACAFPGATPTWPSQGIATGAEFGLSFLQNDAAKPSGVIFPASPARVAVTELGFRGLEPGQVAMLVRTSEGNGILDFRHLGFVAPRKLTVGSPTEATGSEPLQLGFGAERVVEVFPVDGENQKLSGSLVYAWTTDAPNVVALKQPSRFRKATIAVREAGTAHLQISAQGVAEVLTLTVVVAGGVPSGGGGGNEKGN